MLRCPDHDVELVAPGAPAPPASADTPLGRFHPAIAVVLTDLLQRRHIDHEQAVGADGIELLVPDDERADLRSELVINWPDLLGRVDEEDRDEVRALGGQLPGWFDPPSGAWVDRQGKLQVSDAADDEHLEDASRTIGPSLVVLGVAALLLGWYLGGEVAIPLTVGGLGAAILGVFLPR